MIKPIHSSRILRILGIGFIGFLLGCSDQQKVASKFDLSTPQSTIEAVFQTFQENDSSSFLGLTATLDELETFYKESDSIQGGTINQEELKKKVDDQKKSRSRFLKSFTEIHEEGIADGIKDWSQTHFVRGTYELASDNKLIQRYPKIEFTYGDFTGSIKLSVLLIKRKRGWLMAHPAQGLWGPNYQKMHPSSLDKFK